MEAKAALRDYFEKNRDRVAKRIVDLTTEMVREKTINVVSEKLSDFPELEFRGEEYRVAKIVTREFEAWGIPHETFARMEGRPNVVGRLGRGESERRLLMPAHMDIVPAGDGWDTDPFEAVVQDGRLVGRGTLDNKGPLAAIMIAAAILKELGLDRQLKGELLVAALADEEAEDPDGIDYGIGFLLEEKHIAPTFAVIPDIGENMKSIDVAEKGRTVIKAIATGKQAHGSTPERGINAVFMMAGLVREIERLELDHQVHDVLGSPSLNLGEIQGGAAPNIVPGSCTIYLDIRTVPGMTRDGVLTQLADCGAMVRDGVFDFVVLSWNEPHGIDPKNALVRAIQDNASVILGFTPEPFGMGGGTYAKTLNLEGVLAVGWGPGDDEAFHVANESVEIAQLVDFALLTGLIAFDLIG